MPPGVARVVSLNVGPGPADVAWAPGTVVETAGPRGHTVAAPGAGLWDAPLPKRRRASVDRAAMLAQARVAAGVPPAFSAAPRAGDGTVVVPELDSWPWCHKGAWAILQGAQATTEAARRAACKEAAAAAETAVAPSIDRMWAAVLPATGAVTVTDDGVVVVRAPHWGPAANWVIKTALETGAVLSLPGKLTVPATEATLRALTAIRAATTVAEIVADPGLLPPESTLHRKVVVAAAAAAADDGRLHGSGSGGHELVQWAIEAGVLVRPPAGADPTRYRDFKAELAKRKRGAPMMVSKCRSYRRMGDGADCVKCPFPVPAAQRRNCNVGPGDTPADVWARKREATGSATAKPPCVARFAANIGKNGPRYDMAKIAARVAGF